MAGQRKDDLADLDDSDLRNANLTDADLSAAIVTSADLEDAILNYAILDTADLRSANLTGGDLNSANLSNAWLHNTILVGADLTDVLGLGSTVGSPTYDSDTDFTGTGFDPVAAGWRLIPEPTTGLLLGLGLLGVAVRRRSMG